MKRLKFVWALAGLSLPINAIAATKVVQPIQVGVETVRYRQGVPTLDLQGKKGAVQITPLDFDSGGLSFSIAVLNDGDQPTNVDVSNVTMTANGLQVPVLTKTQLVKRAQNRAMWAQIAVAMVGGVAAAAAASQTNTYTSTLYTPRGTYRAVSTGPSSLGQVQAGVIAAGTGVSIASIQNRLDETRAALGNNIVQLTTVDPGESYAGQIIANKIKKPTDPQRVDVVVDWNGEQYPFAFQIAKEGTKPPAFTALTGATQSTSMGVGSSIAVNEASNVQATPVGSGVGKDASKPEGPITEAKPAVAAPRRSNQRIGYAQILVMRLVLTFCALLISQSVSGASGTQTANYSIAALSWSLPPDSVIGPLRAGMLCLPKGKLRWREIRLPDKEDAINKLSEALRSQGLETVDAPDPIFADPTPPTRYRLQVTIMSAKMRLCIPGASFGPQSSRGSGTLTVRWQTFDRHSHSLVHTNDFIVPVVIGEGGQRQDALGITSALTASASLYARDRISHRPE